MKKGVKYGFYGIKTLKKHRKDQVHLDIYF